jgi:hypothetical protein
LYVLDRHFKKKCAGAVAGTDPCKRLTVRVEFLYDDKDDRAREGNRTLDADAVQGVLRSLYKPKSYVDAWLPKLELVALLSIFDVTSTLGLLDLREVVQTFISKKLRRTTNLDTINSYIRMYADLHSTPQLFGYFGAELSFLKCRKGKQRATLRKLRDPKTRGKIPEEAYQSFLDAVEASNWTQQMAKISDGEATPEPGTLYWGDDESE